MLLAHTVFRTGVHSTLAGLSLSQLLLGEAGFLTQCLLI